MAQDLKDQLASLKIDRSAESEPGNPRRRRALVAVLLGVLLPSFVFWTVLRNKAIPVVCVREPGLGFTAISSHTLDVTCRALDADAFIDLAKMKHEPERESVLRSAIHGLLTKGG